jgi:hypothetical protein
MRMVFGLNGNGHVDDVNVIFGIDLWCFKVLGEVRAVRIKLSLVGTQYFDIETSISEQLL